MNVVSLNVGLPREVAWKGRVVRTGIFKSPQDGPVMLRTLNLDGDRQADLSVHGGPSKAVYAYPSEHYAYWRTALPGPDLPWGMFGENLTIEGLGEAEACIGDRFSIGSAEVMVTEPRMPCHKLGLKFRRTDIIKKFLASRRTGFYLAVLREGLIQAGDVIRRISGDPRRVSVADVTELYLDTAPDPESLRRVLEVEALPEAWRTYFQAGMISQRPRATAAPNEGARSDHDRQEKCAGR